MTNINLCADEAQALLDGINVVIKEKARDIAFAQSTSLHETVAKLRAEKRVAESARRKVQGVR